MNRDMRARDRGPALLRRASIAGGRRSRCARSLQRVLADLTRTDAQRDLDGLDPELAVTDLAGARFGRDDVGHLLGLARLDQHVDAHLREEVDLVLTPPIDLGVPALASVAAHVG